MTTPEQSNKIVFNTPSNIDLNSIFPDMKSGLDKVAFLLHQINFFTPNGGYSLNARNHDTLFGKNGLTSKIVKVLLKENIIAPVGAYVVSRASTKFKMVKPFKIEKNNINNPIYNSTFFDTEEKLPVFIQRWIADNYKVKDKNTTNYKPSKEVSSTDDVTLLEEIKALKKALKEANATIDKLSNQLAEVEIISTAKEVLTGSTINNLVEVVKASATPTATNNAIINSKSQAPEFLTGELEHFFGSPISKDNNKWVFSDFQLKLENDELVLESSIGDFDSLKRFIEKTLN